MWQGLIMQILGIWLAVMPTVSVDMYSVKLINFLFGLSTAALSACVEVRKVWVSWLGIIPGAWLAFASNFQMFVAGESYLWSNMISGVMIFIAGVFILNSDPMEKKAKTPAHGL